MDWFLSASRKPRVAARIGARAVGLAILAGITSSALSVAAGGDTATPISRAAECSVAARPRVEFEALVGLPTPSLAVPRATLPAEPLSGGATADQAVVNAISSTMRELIACINEGDLARSAALMTDDYFSQFFRGIDTRDVDRIFGTPTPLPPQLQAQLKGIDDVRIVSNGQVSAVVTVNDTRNLISFVRSGEHYLVDDSIPLPDAGTPTP